MNPPYSFRDLDPPSLRLCLEVEKFCLEKISSLAGKTFLLALSGGADSTALGIIFSILAQRHFFSMHGIYINHHLRPEAAEEMQFVHNLCINLNFPFHYAEFQTRKYAREYGVGLEEAGRTGRYGLFEAFRKKVKADHILVGHHAGDLSEDILMRMVRGTGWPALGGMRSVHGHIFRPLLHITKERLRSFLRYLEHDWREDLSNNDQAFRRNRIRARFLPFLRAENPSIEKSFHNLHQLSLADEEFWHNYLDAILNKYPFEITDDDFGQGLRISLKAICNEAQAVRLRLYHYLIEKLVVLYPLRQRPHVQFEKLSALDKAIILKHSGKIFQFQGRLVARVSKDYVSFTFQN